MQVSGLDTVHLILDYLILRYYLKTILINNKWKIILLYNSSF